MASSALTLAREGETYHFECRVVPVDEQRALTVLRMLPSTSLPSERAEEPAADVTSRINRKLSRNLELLANLIDIQTPGINDPSARLELEATRDRLHSVALLHDHLCEVDARESLELNFGPYAKRIVGRLVEKAGGEDLAQRIEIITDFPDHELPMAQCLPLGIILNELVSNSLRHGFPDEKQGTIRISLEGVGTGEIMLTITDDGIGLPDGFDASESRGTGFRIISVLVDQLGGRLEHVRSPATRFLVAFPASTTIREEGEEQAG